MAQLIDDEVSPATMAALFEWLRVKQPKVYAGLVKRFAQPAQLNGFWDSVGNAASSAVTAATNFVNSQGFNSLLNAAKPFVDSKIQQQQLEQQLRAAQAGITVTSISPSGTQTVVAPGAPSMPASGPTGAGAPISWGPVALIGGGLLAAVLLLRR